MYGFSENVTVYEPVLRSTETDVNVPYYIVFTGTATAYDIYKDLDIMSDYVGFEDTFTAFSLDVSAIIGQIRSAVESNNQKIVLIGHSLGASYCQSVVYNFCTEAPELKDRIQKVYYFNPFVVITKEYKYIEEECLNNLGFRNKFIINIVNHDYASLIFRTRGYGQIFVYPNTIPLTGNGFIDQLADEYMGTTIYILRDTFLNYTNHNMENWTTEYPDEREPTTFDVAILGRSISIHSLKIGTIPKHKEGDVPLYIKGYTPRVEGILKSDFPDENDDTELVDSELLVRDYKFSVTRPSGFLQSYFYYEFNGVKKVSFPYILATSQGYAEQVWFINSDNVVDGNGVITQYQYGLGTIDQSGSLKFNLLNNNEVFSSLLGENLLIHTQAYYFDSTRDVEKYVPRTKFIIQGPLEDAGLVRRTIEPNYMETGKYWRIKNLAFDKWLVMADGWGSHIPFAVADNSNALTSNGLTSEDHSNKYYNVTGDDEAIWNILHNDGDTFYTIKNTRYNKDMLERVLQGSTTPNDLSQYLANASPDHWQNYQIYMTHISKWNNYDFLLYVIEPNSNKKQYLTIRNAGTVNNQGTLIGCSEDNFDPNSIYTDSNYPTVISNNDTNIINSNTKKYEQFVWRFYNATANIATI